MASKYVLSIFKNRALLSQQTKRHARYMGTLAYQYLHSQHETNTPRDEWSHELSFASPESDFVSSSFPRDTRAKESEWSHSLSFTSPEADFTAGKVQEAVERQSKQLSHFNADMLISSPESALGSVHVTEFMTESMKAKFLASQGVQYKETHKEIMFQEFVDNMSLMASPETASGFVSPFEMLDEESKMILSRLQARETSIPKTLEEAMADSRAVVVTSLTSPFDIIDVNDAWVGLCGYKREEALNQNLGKLLQGPDTNAQTAQSMISQLRREHFASAMITNYTKQGRKFKNKVQAGILSDEQGNAKYFVGVLEEMYDYEAGKMSI